MSDKICRINTKRMHYGLVFICMLYFLGSSSAYAASWIVQNGTIANIANVEGGTDLFSVTISGGVGVCADGLVRFPLSAAASQKSHDRAYSMALTAFTTGARVNIYNYADDTCHNASLIQMVK